MKILHTGDWHVRDRDISEIEKCLDFLVETARAEIPDIIIHSGDVFDAAGIRADSLSAKLVFKIFKELADIASVVVVIGTPSHDSDTASILQYIKARFPVHVSTRPEQIYLCEGDLNIDPSELIAPNQAPIETAISLVPAPTKQFFQTDNDIKGADSEIAQAMSGIFAGFAAQAEAYDCCHILVGHWQVGGAMVSETQIITGIDIEISKDQMALGNFDLVCLGHLHLAQEIKPNIFYSGSIYANNFGELEDKGFYIHTISRSE